MQTRRATDLAAVGFAVAGIAATASGRAKGAELPDVARPGVGGYVSGQLIYPLDERPTPQCHASTIAETRSGLLAAWFGGTREKHNDVSIWVSRKRGEGGWSRPVRVADGEDRDYPGPEA